MQVILVTIVSEQTVPSVLFIKEFQKSVDSYLFVSTEKMDKKREAICIAAGVRIDQCLPTILVNENSLIDIEQKLSALEFPPESRFVVNLTGGTKLMSFGVYDFFKKFEHEAYYLPIGRNEMLRVFSGAAVKPTPIAYRLSVKEYLDSYSLSFVKDERRQPKFSREQANVLFNSNISNFDRHKVCTDSIWKFRNNPSRRLQVICWIPSIWLAR